MNRSLTRVIAVAASSIPFSMLLTGCSESSKATAKDDEITVSVSNNANQSSFQSRLLGPQSDLGNTS